MAFLKVKVKGAHWCPVLCNPMDYTMQSSLGQNTGVSSLSILQGISPTQGAAPGLPLSALPAEPPGKPKNTGVSSLSLLQGNLPNLGIEPISPALQADSLPAEPQGKSCSEEAGK